MDRSIGSRVGLIVLTALAMVGAFFVHLLFLAEECGVGAGKGRVPAHASLQGQFCGDTDFSISLVLFGFEAAAIFAVIFFIMAYRGARTWAGKVASFLVPVLAMGFAWGALSLPSDTCSDEAAKTEPAADCATRVK